MFLRNLTKSVLSAVMLAVLVNCAEVSVVMTEESQRDNFSRRYIPLLSDLQRHCKKHGCGDGRYLEKQLKEHPAREPRQLKFHLR